METTFIKNDLKNKNVLILRAGISGISAAKLCLMNKANVYLYDKSIDSIYLDKEILERCILLNDNNINNYISLCDIVIISPAIRMHSDIYKKLNSKTIISEIELGYLYSKNKIIAITGTNGKTTTSKLCHYIFNDLQIKNGLYGNIGIGYAENINIKTGFDILEISAQQLEHIEKFRPFISVITNIESDHINPYDKEAFFDKQYYTNCKLKIFSNQNESDYCIFNYNISNIKEIVEKCNAKIIYFSIEKKVPKGFYYYQKKIYYCDCNNIYKIFDNNNNFFDKDIIESILIILCILLVVYPKKISEKDIKLFKKHLIFENRLEFVSKHNKRIFINDSKATNIYSTIYAIKNYNNSILICGSNSEKLSDYNALAEEIKKNCKFVVLFDETKFEIEKKLLEINYHQYNISNNIYEAVNKAYSVSEENDYIIFSPGGNSKPTFKNHVERGTIFKSIININYPIENESFV